MTNKEKAILEHIDKIEQFAKKPENEWLLAELERRFGGKQTQNDAIQRVEKYLGLDYKLDSVKSLIDYSYVKDNCVRNQLVSDNREMLRYRYGVRSHKIDFDEFCRYAHLQAEALINYYYKSICVDFATLKGRIMQYNSNAKINDDYPEVESIVYGYKIYAIIAELFPPTNNNYLFSVKGKKICSSLSNVKDVRNQQSHRSHRENYETLMTKFENDVKTEGLPWDESNKDFIWKEINESEKYENLYKTIYKNRYKEYNYYKWYLQQPFDEIIEALKILSERIKDQLFIKV
ncbi:MAG: hypothetical protein IKS33_08770 [Bacteroidales bacterium]|nr:hypothetical protein [Bacteroidales bacterium]